MEAAGAADSSNVFHSPQSGHLPNHLEVMLPQFVQMYVVFGATRAASDSSVLDVPSFMNSYGMRMCIYAYSYVFVSLSTR